MKDVQSGPSEVALSIDRVGVKDLQLPVRVRMRDDSDVFHTVAEVDLSVDLPAHFKGTHMSRFLEALESWSEALDYKSFKNLLQSVCDRLEARRAHIHFRFPYFLTKNAPASGRPGLMNYQCSLTGELEAGTLTWGLGVEVPVMTVCPCSLAISNGGAHSQRALVNIFTRHEGLLWIEDIIEIAESSGSQPVYALLKRSDEKAVTDAAFDNPTFVEDVVRNAARALDEHPQVLSYKVEVESQESIHNHNAYAVIESTA